MKATFTDRHPSLRKRDLIDENTSHIVRTSTSSSYSSTTDVFTTMPTQHVESQEKELFVVKDAATMNVEVIVQQTRLKRSCSPHCGLLFHWIADTLKPQLG
jgi:hypothetical protein